MEDLGFDVIGDARDAGLPHLGSDDWFVGLIDGWWWEAVRTYYFDWKIQWSESMAWGRMGQVLRMHRHITYYRLVGDSVWREWDGPNGKWLHAPPMSRCVKLRGEDFIRWIN